MSTPSFRSRSRQQSLSLPYHSSSLYYCLRILAMSGCIFSVIWITSLFTLSSSWVGLVGVYAISEDSTTSAAAEDIHPSLTRAQLEDMVQNLRGNDLRIMRWNAKSHTRKQQNDGGCEALPQVLDLILQTTSASVDETFEDLTQRQALACDYLTFCITDNPQQRARLSEYSDKNVYQAIVSLVGSPDPDVSAKASHVIYIASFANKANHWGFYRAGAMAALSNVILRYPISKDSIPDDSSSTNATSTTTTTAIPMRADQFMWASAALQNMAASYCATEQDGRCYWHWSYVGGSIAHELQIAADSLPVISEGTSMRYTALQHDNLIPHLAQLVCQFGPVQGLQTDENPYPGDQARIDRDENSSNLVAWAAAGAIKNLALDPVGRHQVEQIQQLLLPCLCRLSHSQDWLEENKGQGALNYIRIGDPCWFESDISGVPEGGTSPNEKGEGELVCIDDNFKDESGYHCGDYIHPSAEDCETTDVLDATLTGRQACCSCGGGMRLKKDVIDQEL